MDAVVADMEAAMAARAMAEVVADMVASRADMAVAVTDNSKVIIIGVWCIVLIRALLNFNVNYYAHFLR